MNKKLNILTVVAWSTLITGMILTFAVNITEALWLVGFGGGIFLSNIVYNNMI